MEKDLFYWLDEEHENDDFSEIEMLNDVISKAGVTVEIKRYSSGVGINFKYDTEKVKNQRGAGRPKYKYQYTVTVDEVRQRLNAGETAEQIAKDLGISRATLFRKLKYAEEKGFKFIL